ncbi:hypothetical protein AGMMS49992_11970 [Clostridia bacterium]|nr:hypothetical protein AGMMS49992_11970 [Clostridia bacterium]
MATRNLTAPLSQHGGTAARMAANNPVLKNRELGVETDTRRIKIGNGSTTWNNLDYIATGTQAVNVSLAASAWSSGAATISNTNIKAASNGFVTIQNTATVAQYNAYTAARPYVTSTANGSIKLTAAGTAPTVAIPLTIILLG